MAMRLSCPAGPWQNWANKHNTQQQQNECFWSAHTARAGRPESLGCQCERSSTRTQRMNVHEKRSQSIAGHGASVVVGGEGGWPREDEPRLFWEGGVCRLRERVCLCGGGGRWCGRRNCSAYRPPCTQRRTIGGMVVWWRAAGMSRVHVVVVGQEHTEGE